MRVGGCTANETNLVGYIYIYIPSPSPPTFPPLYSYTYTDTYSMTLTLRSCPALPIHDVVDFRAHWGFFSPYIFLQP